MKTVIGVVAVVSCVAAPLSAQEPLCIVNGVRVAASICTARGGLRPEGIESIEILKGQAAAAEYGAEAAGGVISITTKTGAEVLPLVVDDPFARDLFPPELVMAHQQAIGLTDRQRTAMQQAMREAQSAFVGLQFTLRGEVEKLQQLLQGTSIDQAAVLEQVDRVLAAERQVKRTQLTLMVRIKNQLTPEQQGTLRTLRR